MSGNHGTCLLRYSQYIRTGGELILPRLRIPPELMGPNLEFINVRFLNAVVMTNRKLSGYKLNRKSPKSIAHPLPSPPTPPFISGLPRNVWNRWMQPFRLIFELWSEGNDSTAIHGSLLIMIFFEQVEGRGNFIIEETKIGWGETAWNVFFHFFIAICHYQLLLFLTFSVFFAKWRS